MLILQADTLRPVIAEQIQLAALGCHRSAAMEVQCDVVALLVEIDDVEILNRFLEGESQVQLKRNRPQAVIVQRHLFGKQDNLSNLTDIGWSELIGEIRLDLLRGRIVKPEVLVEPSRTIHKVVVELIQAVAGDDEKLFPLSGPIEHAQQR